MAFTIMNLPLIPQENVLGYLNLDDVMCFEVACRGFECDANGVSTILQHRKLEKMIFKYRPHTFPFAALSSLFSSVRRCDFSAQSVKAEHLPLFRGIANLEAVSFDCCEELLPEDLESFFASFSSLKYISINNVFPVCESVQLPVSIYLFLKQICLFFCAPGIERKHFSRARCQNDNVYRVDCYVNVAQCIFYTLEYTFRRFF